MALALVQSTSVPTSGAGTGVFHAADVAITLGSATTSGNLIVVVATMWNNFGSITGVDDNQGNTYTQAQQVNGGFAQCAVFYCANATGGASHTVNVRTTTCYGTASVCEVSGAATASPVDLTDSDLSDVAIGATSFGITSSTLAQADEIVFALGMVNTSEVPTGYPGSPWNTLYTREDYGADHNGSAVYQIVASTSPVTATWTCSFTGGPFYRANGVVSFKAAAGGGGGDVAFMAAAPTISRRVIPLGY